ncbi:MAG: hypothetical protein NZX77_20400 [Polyangiaceae bacterium]|nr:hypothetical protein [Polyangiaceae bacterium]
MARIRTFVWSGPHLLKRLDRLILACVPDDERVLLGVALRHEQGSGPLPTPFHPVGTSSRWPGTRGTRATIWITRVGERSSLPRTLELARRHGARDPFFWLPSKDGKSYARLATSEHNGTAWTTLPEEENYREGALLAEGFSLACAEAPTWLEVQTSWKIP